MKKFILKYSNHIYLLTLIIILIVYLFPGDIVSYLISGNLNSNINYNENPIGYSFYWIVNTGGYSTNHVLTFMYISTFGFLTFFKNKFYSGLLFFVLLSVLLEILHFTIPNRSFQLVDLLCNLLGVIIVSFIFWKLKR